MISQDYGPEERFSKHACSLGCWVSDTPRKVEGGKNYGTPALKAAPLPPGHVVGHPEAERAHGGRHHGHHQNAAAGARLGGHLP